MKNLARVLKATAANIVSSPSTCSPTRVVGVGHPPQFHLARRLMAPKATDAATEPQIMDSSSSSYGDPCLDIFFNVRPPPPPAIAAHSSHTDTALINSLKQQLPVAWSHNLFTTLKLIYDLSTNHLYLEALSVATSWLHHNHPSTLARNLDYFDGLYTLVDILYNLLLPQDQQETEVEETEGKIRLRSALQVVAKLEIVEGMGEV